MYKKWVLIVVAVVVIAISVSFLLPTKTYRLVLSNQSTISVDSIRVFGSALEQEYLIENLVVGTEQTLSLTLAKRGTLKYEVQQGTTRVDTFIVKDVSTLEHFHQQLTVEPGNRFLMSTLQ